MLRRGDCAWQSASWVPRDRNERAHSVCGKAPREASCSEGSREGLTEMTSPRMEPKATTCSLKRQLSVKHITSASSMHDAGHSKPVLWDNPEGWGGKGQGSGVQDGGHMCTCGQFMSVYGKNYHNVVK